MGLIIFLILLGTFLPAAGFGAQSPEIYLQPGFTHGFDGAKAPVFSHNGQFLAAVSGDGSIKIWETGSGREVQTLTGHGGAITNLAFMPDNHRIVSGSNDRTIKLWDIHSGSLIRSFQGHKGDIRSIAVSKDGSLMASAEAAAVKVWDINSGRMLASIAAPADGGSSSGYIPPVMSLVFYPDASKLIFSNIQSSLFIVDLRQQRIISTMTNRQLNCYTNLKFLDFAHDGRLIIGSLQTLLLVDLERLEVINKKTKKDV